MASVRRLLGRLRRAVMPASRQPASPGPASRQPDGLAGLTPAATAHLVECRHGRDRLLCQPWPGGGWRDILGANLAAVTSTLEAAGLDHWVLDAAWDRPPVVVVRQSAAAAAGRALLATLGPLGHHVIELGDQPGGNTPQPVRLLAAGLPQGHTWRLFLPRCTPAGEFLSGAEAACEVQLWWEANADSEPLGNHEQFDPGSLVAPTPTGNRWTHVLPAGHQQRTRAVVAGVDVPVPTVLDHPHIFDTRLPVDVVYTWVDGSDPGWQQRRAAARTDGAPARHALADNPSRYLSHDELRYSLRSLEFYADWVNHVWLVTDGQVPAWLVPDHPRLTVVDHRDIFTDPTVLPVFNSHAIESQLHHIEGLAEHFVYLNDDVFFTCPTPPEQFVLANGTTTFHPSTLTIGAGPVRAGDTPVVQAGKQNRTLLEARAGVSISQRIKHVPHTLRRSVLADLEAAEPALFARTAAARFRSATDHSIVSSLAHYHGFLAGTAVPWPIRHLYADIAAEKAAATLASLRALRGHTVLCLNDTSTDPSHERAAAMVADFLGAYFPYPSSFETTGATDGPA